MDKTKFVVNPHLDSEGFVKYGPPHYLGELTDNQREDQRINAVLANAHIDGLSPVDVMYERMANTAIGKEVLARRGFLNPHTGEVRQMPHLQLNPQGWQEVDGVKLPPINWAERSDEEVEAAFQEWQSAR